MSIKASNVVRRLFVFCPKLGRKEGEENKKLLYYFPNTETLDYRIQTVGFAEAVIGFADTFRSPTDDKPSPYYEVGTDKELQINCRVENDYVIGVVLNKQACAEQKYAARGRVVYNILRRLYHTFVLFFGQFDRLTTKKSEDVSSDIDVEGLKDRLEYFCSRYLSALRLSQVPLFDLLDGVTYVKCDSTTYLNVQTMINRMNEKFPFIAHSLLLCNDRLLWYNVSKSDLVVLYRYLIQNLLPLSLRNELLQPDVMKRDSSSSSITSTTSQHFGKFITGGSGANEISASSPIVDSTINLAESKLPYVYLHQKCAGPLVDHYLIAYRVLNVTLTLLVPIKDASVYLSPEFYRTFDQTIGSLLSPLASALVDAYGKECREDAAMVATHQYIFFNNVDSSLCTNFGNIFGNIPSVINSPISSSSAPPLILQSAELYGALTDLREEIDKAAYFGDVVAKCGDDDYWVAAKKADDREIYAVIYHKNATLIDIHEEMRKLCSSKFDNKFLLE